MSDNKVAEERQGLQGQAEGTGVKWPALRCMATRVPIALIQWHAIDSTTLGARSTGDVDKAKTQLLGAAWVKTARENAHDVANNTVVSSAHK